MSSNKKGLIPVAKVMYSEKPNVSGYKSNPGEEEFTEYNHKATLSSRRSVKATEALETDYSIPSKKVPQKGGWA